MRRCGYFGEDAYKMIIVHDGQQRGEKCCIFAADLGERSVATAYLLLIYRLSTVYLPLDHPTNTEGNEGFFDGCAVLWHVICTVMAV